MKCKCGAETVESYANHQIFQYCRVCKIEVHPAQLLKSLYSDSSNKSLSFKEMQQMELPGLSAWLPEKPMVIGTNRQSPKQYSIEEQIFHKAALISRQTNQNCNICFISVKNFEQLINDLGLPTGVTVTLNGSYGPIQVYMSPYLNEQICLSGTGDE